VYLSQRELGGSSAERRAVRLSRKEVGSSTLLGLGLGLGVGVGVAL
jgi:hypothetical protein